MGYKLYAPYLAEQQAALVPVGAGALGRGGEVYGLRRAAEVQIEPASKPVHQRCDEKHENRMMIQREKKRIRQTLTHLQSGKRKTTFSQNKRKRK